jgi:type VI secretion system FHA domain protein
MYLRLKASTAYANDDANQVEAIFGRDGGTIGRDPRCQMVLHDPMRRISRIQGQIVWQNDAFHIVNASTSNLIYVNDRELNPGDRSMIGQKEEWRTGSYRITVESTSNPNLEPMAQTQLRAVNSPPDLVAVAQVAPSPVSPPPATQLPQLQAASLSDPLESTYVQGPFDDLLSVPIKEEYAGMSSSPSQVNLETPHSRLHADPFATASAPIPESSRSLFTDQRLDPFADLMGEPKVNHAPSAPKNYSANTKSALIPDDFNPMSMGGLSYRNIDDPLKNMPSSGNISDMFPERSLDAIFQPTEGSIETMTRDPLQASHHQSFMDPSSKLDPLAIFSEDHSEDSLNPEFLFGNSNVHEKTHADHKSELSSYFRAPRPLDPTAKLQHAPLPEAKETFTIDLGFDATDLSSDIAAPASLKNNELLQSPVATQTSPVAPEKQAAVDSTQAISLDAFFDLSAPSDSLTDLEAGATPVVQSSLPTTALPSTPSTQAQAQAPLDPLAQHASAPTAPITQYPIAQSSNEPGTLQTSNLYGAQDASGSTPAEQVPSAIKADNNAQQLLDAFKRGAGLSDCRYPEHITPEMMFMVGQMLGASVQGCMDLLGSRAAAKQEVRMAVTLINEEANNPLKFLPTGASALAQIFGPRMPGFMSGPVAMENAHHDLRTHEVGMMAGTQAAVQGLFERFDPQLIESQLESQGRHKPLFTSQRHARLWEMYCIRYQWLKDEMKNQTPASWGSEFHGAYQTEKDSIDSKGAAK